MQMLFFLASFRNIARKSARNSAAARGNLRRPWRNFLRAAAAGLGGNPGNLRKGWWVGGDENQTGHPWRCGVRSRWVCGHLRPSIHSVHRSGEGREKVQRSEEGGEIRRDLRRKTNKIRPDISQEAGPM